MRKNLLGFFVAAIIGGLLTGALPASAGNSNLERRIARLERKTASLQSQVSTMQSDITALKTWRNDHIQNNNAWFDSLDQRSKTLESRTSKLTQSGTYTGGVDGYQVTAPTGFSCWGALAEWSGTTGHLVC